MSSEFSFDEVNEVINVFQLPINDLWYWIYQKEEYEIKGPFKNKDTAIKNAEMYYTETLEGVWNLTDLEVEFDNLAQDVENIQSSIHEIIIRLPLLNALGIEDNSVIDDFIIFVNRIFNKIEDLNDFY